MFQNFSAGEKVNKILWKYFGESLLNISTDFSRRSVYGRVARSRSLSLKEVWVPKIHHGNWRVQVNNQQGSKPEFSRKKKNKLPICMLFHCYRHLELAVTCDSVDYHVEIIKATKCHYNFIFHTFWTSLGFSQYLSNTKIVGNQWSYFRRIEA